MKGVIRMSVKDDHKRITVTFTDEDYEALKLIATKGNISMSELVRGYTIEGLSGTLTQQNMEFLVPIIREQLRSILDPAVNRLALLYATALFLAFS
jgi:predicted CopG family antitoxin